MTALVVGGTGATGRLLVRELLNRNQAVRVIVRSADGLPSDIRSHELLTMTAASVLDLSDAELVKHVDGCDAVASCLGHNLSFKGIYGRPRRLVTDATRRLCDAVKTNASSKSTKFVLMNTAGNRNPDADEHISVAQRFVITLIRALLPPHADNEDAAEYLRAAIGGADVAIEWAVVRPDDLTDDEEVTDYETHASPIRSAIFDPGSTSRINVAHFMAELMTDTETWTRWKGQMPVIYNKDTTS